MGLNQNVHTCTGFHAIIIVFLVESGDCFQFCFTVIDGFLMPSLTGFYGEDSVVGPHFVDGFCLTIHLTSPPLFQPFDVMKLCHYPVGESYQFMFSTLLQLYDEERSHRGTPQKILFVVELTVSFSDAVVTTSLAHM